MRSIILAARSCCQSFLQRHAVTDCSLRRRSPLSCTRCRSNASRLRVERQSVRVRRSCTTQCCGPGILGAEPATLEPLPAASGRGLRGARSECRARPGELARARPLRGPASRTRATLGDAEGPCSSRLSHEVARKEDAGDLSVRCGRPARNASRLSRCGPGAGARAVRIAIASSHLGPERRGVAGGWHERASLPRSSAYAPYAVRDHRMPRASSSLITNPVFLGVRGEHRKQVGGRVCPVDLRAGERAVKNRTRCRRPVGASPRELGSLSRLPTQVQRQTIPSAVDTLRAAHRAPCPVYRGHAEQRAAGPRCPRDAAGSTPGSATCALSPYRSPASFVPHSPSVTILPPPRAASRSRESLDTYVHEPTFPPAPGAAARAPRAGDAITLRALRRRRPASAATATRRCARARSAGARRALS